MGEYMTLRDISDALDIKIKTLRHHATTPKFPLPKSSIRPKLYDIDEVRNWYSVYKLQDNSGWVTHDELAACLCMSPHTLKDYKKIPGFPSHKTVVQPKKYDANEVRQWFYDNGIGPYKEKGRTKKSVAQTYKDVTEIDDIPWSKPFDFKNPSMQIRFLAGHYDRRSQKQRNNQRLDQSRMRKPPVEIVRIRGEA